MLSLIRRSDSSPSTALSEHRTAGPSFGPLIALIGFILLLPPSVLAVPPNPPTGLTVSYTIQDSSNILVSFDWNDNSTDEDRFVLSHRVGSFGQFYELVNITSETPPNTMGPVGVTLTFPADYYTVGSSMNFHMMARKGTVFPETSTPSNIAVINSWPNAAAQNFAAPTNLGFTLPAPEQVQLTWNDNANSEWNYEIQYRFQGDTNFTSLAFPTFNTTSYTVSGVPPAPIEFRVCGTRGTQAETKTAFTNTVTASATLAAPTNLAGSSPSEGKFNVSWTDNSTVEGNYELQVRVKGTSTFFTYDYYDAGANTGTINKANQAIDPGFIYEFRVRATYGSSAQYTSAFSNVIEIAVPFNAPTAFTATTINDRQINLAWQDNSAVETSYAVLCKQSTASQYQICALLAANSNSFQVRFEDSDFNIPLVPNTTYNFQVIAVSGDGETNPLTATATTKDGTNSDLSPPMFVGEAFSHPVTFTEGQGTVTSASVTGTLPPGITYDTATRTFSGNATSRGAFTPTLQVDWSNGWSNNYTLHLRPIHRPGRPVVNNAISAQTLTLGGTSTASIPLAGVFSDPDSESAVRIDIPAADGTPAGRSITIILNDSVTPQTVANFMAYLNNATDGYKDTIFQRLATGFVLQGGSLKSSTAQGAPSNAFVQITKLPPVANEPGVSNTFGTLAMAKQAGNPNSATADFFFNLANNSGNLDVQNDGFTVFGRVTQGSLALLSTLNGLPLPPSSGNPNAPNYAVTIDGANSFLTQLPHNVVAATGPATIDSSKLVRINDVVTNIPLLTRSVAGNTNAAAVTAVINGGNLDLTALAPGSVVISLQATDLDGNTLQAPSAFTVTVNQTFTHWAGTQGLPPGEDDPAADPDDDGSENLAEWALMTNPNLADAEQTTTAALQTDGGNKKGSITFKVRKFAPGIIYTVESSGDLMNWIPIWASTDGFSAPAVFSAADNPDHTLVTIRDTAAVAAGSPRFLRVKITSP